ncbi:MAG: aspartate kinase [Atopobiaceae bacterium]|nr:aspartate kinase [Atopobiaceae bacterium]
MITITKFGGTSTANAEQFRKIKDIIAADPSRKFVVVSAAGKRDKKDNKATDLLFLVNAHVAYHVDSASLLDDVGQRFYDIADELGLSYPIREEYGHFASNINAYDPNYVVSRGEYFTAKLMSEWLDLPFVDAADVVVFHHDGTFDLERTQMRVRDAAHRVGRFVMPGYYGATVDGEIMLLDRGGGDVSGSILARCLEADLYENWTDVSGFLTADPRIVKKPKPIRRITFDELRELSYMGANVLHEEAIFPVREANIPIAIKNTNRPEDKGTIIRETAREGEDEPVITGIAGSKGFLSVHIRKTHMSTEVGFLRKALEIFDRYGVSIEHIPTGIDSFGVIVNADDVKKNIYAIINDIQKTLSPDEVKVVDELALISVVGRNMAYRPGVAGTLFTALGKQGISVRMITQSSQEINITFGVNSSDFEDTIRAIYDEFVAKEEGNE